MSGAHKQGQGRWSYNEVDQLESMIRRSTTNAEIAEKLGRSKSSVASMRFKVRNGLVSLKPTWSDDEIDVVRKTRHLTAHQVADVMEDRSVHAVNKIRAHLIRTEGVVFDCDKDPFEVGTRRLLAKTCIGCGLLLDASWYSRYVHKQKSRLWQPQCTRCLTFRKRKQVTRNGVQKRTEADKAASRKAHSKVQEFTRRHASRHGYPWTDDDHIILRDSSFTLFEKAIKLGRTIGAVSQAAHTNSYTSRVGKGDPLNGVWNIVNPRAKDFNPAESTAVSA